MYLMSRKCVVYAFLLSCLSAAGAVATEDVQICEYPPQEGAWDLLDNATIDIPISFDVGDVSSHTFSVNEVYINISHSFAGDLGAKLIAPDQKIVHLWQLGDGISAPNTSASGCDKDGYDLTISDVGGGPTLITANENEYCTGVNADTLVSGSGGVESPYVFESSHPLSKGIKGTATPIDSLSQVSGSPAAGEWTIRVSDNYERDFGTINELCLSLDFAGAAFDFFISETAECLVPKTDGIFLAGENIYICQAIENKGSQKFTLSNDDYHSDLEIDAAILEGNYASRHTENNVKILQTTLVAGTGMLELGEHTFKTNMYLRGNDIKFTSDDSLFVEKSIELLIDADSDSDGLRNGLDADDDGDGISDTSEISAGTDPLNPDSDNNGICDGIIDVATICIKSGDNDSDGLSNQEELELGCDPNVADSDGDGVSDGPNKSTAGFAGPDIDPSDPNSDTDGDGLSDILESSSLVSSPIWADSDNDGVSDGPNKSTAGFAGPDIDPSDPNSDTDGDGLSDILEASSLVSSPILADSDNDGVSDGPNKSTAGFAGPDIDPSDPNSDTDGDGLSDISESSSMVSSPILVDSDNDNVSDGPIGIPGQIINGPDSEPNNPYSDIDGDGNADINETLEDLDNDGIVNILDTDDDGDGILSSIENGSDGEVLTIMSPLDTDLDGVPNHLDIDSDNDSIDDLVEGMADIDGDGLSNYVDADDTDGPDGDIDDDGLTNGEENILGTNIHLKDTDLDGLSDAQEVRKHKTNPLEIDSDGDGLSDAKEINELGTDPLQTDSDGDGLSDGEEVNRYETNAKSIDTDEDGYNDLTEINNHTDPNIDEKELVKDFSLEGSGCSGVQTPVETSIFSFLLPFLLLIRRRKK